MVWNPRSNPNYHRRTIDTSGPRSIAEIKRTTISGDEMKELKKAQKLAEESSQLEQEVMRELMKKVVVATSKLNKARRLHRRRPKRFPKGVRRLRRLLRLK